MSSFRDRDLFYNELKHSCNNYVFLGMLHVADGLTVVAFLSSFMFHCKVENYFLDLNIYRNVPSDAILLATLCIQTRLPVVLNIQWHFITA